MDGATLQAKIYTGYGQAAKRIGFPCQIYRPSSPLMPLQAAAIKTIPASFSDNGFRYSKPNEYGDPTWMGLFDGNQTQPGDILVGVQGTFFIAAMQKTLPIYCIQAERLVSVLRVSMDSGVGQVGYGGDTTGTEQVLMSDWPASVLQGTKGEQNDAKLPGDVRTPWWAILMPAWPGIVLRTSDIITDDIGRRYTVSSAELTDMGWRITAMQSQV
ncbi:hypothetical protein [Aquitalea magnusonii]|uniref:Uncharacterized protein n=1 Tax=Aquitalea magnusonii TaxID=332411 RepID=A0A318J6H6_9NEIS|nr:hypothetical protein [Aquitalea magnusonii]PXX42218.1 hypothetical protein DFR38_12015 [Aquitalea magnusonii]